MPVTDLKELAGSRAVSGLADLADEYASEIQRSPFFAPLGRQQALSVLGIMFGDSGWHPSHLLTDESLRQRPELAVLLPERGLLSSAANTRQRRYVEAQYRAALVRAFEKARDDHPGYKSLCQIDSFRAVLDAFEAARATAKLASSLRKPEAEAQILVCTTRPLFLLLATDWRAAPTRETQRAARKAAKTLLSAAKDGLHALPSYWQADRALEALLRDLDALPRSPRAPKLDQHTAPTATLASFDSWLEIYFGKATLGTDLRGMRQCYAAMLGFGNPRDKVSP